MEFIKDDNNLKDSLYAEYFEKCISVKGKISREQLDRHGLYRISDYEDIFGNFKNFEQKIEKNLELVLKNYDILKKEKEKELEEIGKDLKNLQKVLGFFPHFEEIKTHSGIGVYRYLIQFKISYLHYLENYKGEYMGIFISLVTEFLRLKEILFITPTKNQFFNLSSKDPALISVNSKLLICKLSYVEFLKTIDVELPPENIDSEHIEKMKNKTIKELKEIEKKEGKEKVISIIESAQNKFDELSISIIAWFEDKNSLKSHFQFTKDT